MCVKVALFSFTEDSTTIENSDNFFIKPKVKSEKANLLISTSTLRVTRFTSSYIAVFDEIFTQTSEKSPAIQK